MTVKQLLPVIPLFRFNYIFGNEIQRHMHHDNLYNHRKIQNNWHMSNAIVFSKVEPKTKTSVSVHHEKMPVRSKKVLLWVLKER